jgi:hypothetical protein
MTAGRAASVAGESVRARWPFVGRDAELDGILTALDDPATLGTVIHGAPGVGKTRLAEEVARDQPAQHVAVFVPDAVAGGLRLVAQVWGAGEDTGEVVVGEWIVPFAGGGLARRSRATRCPRGCRGGRRRAPRSSGADQQEISTEGVDGGVQALHQGRAA